MDRTFDPLSKAEREWVVHHLSDAFEFVKSFPEADETRQLNLVTLDAAYAAWFSTGETDMTVVNSVLNCVGAAFGEILVDGLGLEWGLMSDEYGTDLAVRGLPGTANFLIFPQDFVLKRWERRETEFLESAYYEIAEAFDEVKAEWNRAGRRSS